MKKKRAYQDSLWDELEIAVGNDPENEEFLKGENDGKDMMWIHKITSCQLNNIKAYIANNNLDVVVTDGK